MPFTKGPGNCRDQFFFRNSIIHGIPIDILLGHDHNIYITVSEVILVQAKDLLDQPLQSSPHYRLVHFLGHRRAQTDPDAVRVAGPYIADEARAEIASALSITGKVLLSLPNALHRALTRMRHKQSTALLMQHRK